MDNLRGIKVTVRYDEDNKIVGYGSKKGAAAVMGAKPIKGSLEVDGDIIEDFSDKGYSTGYLKVKNKKLILPLKSIIKKNISDFSHQLYHWEEKYKLHIESQSQFFGQTIFGQLIVISILSLIFLTILKYLIIKEHIIIYDYGDFLRYYLPIFTAMLFIALGLIGINGANQRFNESRKLEIAPIFIIDSLEQVGANGKILSQEIRSKKFIENTNQEESKIIRRNYRVSNIGKGAAFDIWSFLEREDSNFLTKQLCNLKAGKSIDFTFSSMKNEHQPSQIYLVCSDTDGNRHVTRFRLNPNLGCGTPVVTKALKRSHPKFKAINYQIAILWSFFNTKDE